MSVDLLIECVGWLGGGLILAAYGLLTAGKLDADSPAYQAANVVGGLGFVANGWWHNALPSTVLNVIWAGIGVVALIRISAKSRASRA